MRRVLWAWTIRVPSESLWRHCESEHANGQLSRDHFPSRLERRFRQRNAGASSIPRRKATLITLEENPFLRRPIATAMEVGLPVERSARMEQSLARYQPSQRPPCVLISAFFMKGIGDTPTEPVLLTARQGENWGRVVVDPRTATLDVKPVLRVGPSRASPGTEVFLTVEVASGDADFTVLALTRRGGSYAAVSFAATTHRSGWNLLPDDGETLFYALDDSGSWKSPCRTGVAVTSVSGH